jgi:hypothetical protein
VFRIEVNHVKSGFFSASKRNEIFASISNFASEVKVRAHPNWGSYVRGRYWSAQQPRYTTSLCSPRIRKLTRVSCDPFQSKGQSQKILHEFCKVFFVVFCIFYNLPPPPVSYVAAPLLNQQFLR